MLPTYAAAMNRRSQRTRAVLKSAFIDLMLSRGYAPLAVADVIRRAGVGRSTFYLHYAGKEALLADSLEHPCRGLAAYVAGNATPAKQVALLEHFRAQRSLNRVFFEPPIRALWVRVLAQTIARQLARPGATRRVPSGTGASLFCRVVAEMQIALIAQWLNSPAPAKADRIAAMLAAYTNALLQCERTLGPRH